MRVLVTSSGASSSVLARAHMATDCRGPARRSLDSNRLWYTLDLGTSGIDKAGKGVGQAELSR